MTVSVYRHYDDSDKLLYVGKSVNPVQRLQQHKYQSSWYDDIAKVTVEHCENNHVAAAREIEVIRAEQPKFNVHHKNISKPKKTLLYGPPEPTKQQQDDMRLGRLRRENEVIVAIHQSLPASEKEPFLHCNWDAWKRNNIETYNKFNNK